MPPGRAETDAFAAFNARAAARGVRAGSGLPLRFVAPDGDPIGYEQRVFARGEVVTRPGNAHDAHNAEVWLQFPQAKAALNRLHVEALAGAPAAGGRRGRVRDRLTQFDECGVVVAGMPAALWQALAAHRWREVFVAQRAQLVATTRFVVFGHASREALAAPFLGLCGKALWLDVPPAVRDDDARLDAALAGALVAAMRRPATTGVSRWQPLPLLGIPGMTKQNDDPAYYDDERQFRPARTMPAGSPPGSR